MRIHGWTFASSPAEPTQATTAIFLRVIVGSFLGSKRRRFWLSSIGSGFIREPCSPNLTVSRKDWSRRRCSEALSNTEGPPNWGDRPLETIMTDDEYARLLNALAGKHLKWNGHHPDHVGYIRHER